MIIELRECQSFVATKAASRGHQSVFEIIPSSRDGAVTISRNSNTEGEKIPTWRVQWRESDGHLRHRDLPLENCAKEYARRLVCRLNLDLFNAEVSRLMKLVSEPAASVD